MLLYSIASGVSCAGVLLGVAVVMIMLIQSAFVGDALSVFRTVYGIAWPMIFLAVFAFGSTTWGLATVIMLGYQPVDLFVTVIAGIITFGFAWAVNGMLHEVVPRKPRTHKRNIR